MSLRVGLAHPPLLISLVHVMSIQGLAAIENMLTQMREVAKAASGESARGEGVQGQAKASFAAELQRSLQQVSDLQTTATAQAAAFQAGVPGVSLNDVMIDMQKAGIAFQATMQVRNRLVQAYQEIASMPV